MATFTGVWSAEEVEAFLERTTVPLRLACTTPSGRLWMVSLWFRYRDGDLLCATSKGAEVVRYLDDDPHVAFEVSTNDPPYSGVRGNGTVTIEPDAGEETLRALLDRYLGGTDSGLARRLLSSDREEVALRIEPDRVYSWDFADRMRDAT
ncbi:pyridoxamine 5'-phosphate oxidase family protein [Halomicrococcus sp. SG-WS-1]|uniref:pyridoxamine 5'-phosphate oxidase family protein n=1 Tax=Halomicrococcus sp. SG-WS-1 TaxID=3439057 RepID=UPI003F794767